MCVCLVSTVSRDKLDAHLKKCNSRDKAKPVSEGPDFPRERCVEKPPVAVCPPQVYYAEDINAGSPAQSEHSLQQVTPTLLSCLSVTAPR